MAAPDKPKNWEELVNDGDNYGGKGDQYSPMEKIIYECIKDKTILKIQDRFVFAKIGYKETENHAVELARLIAGFDALDDVTSFILTHNKLTPEALRILLDSPALDHINYLHLGSNHLGDEGAAMVAEAPQLAQLETLNLECNGIGPDGGKALARSKYLTQLTSLSLVDNRVGEEGAFAIADSGTLANLTYLHLGGNRVQSEEAKQALRQSSKLVHLKTLKVF